MNFLNFIIIKSVYSMLIAFLVALAYQWVQWREVDKRYSHFIIFFLLLSTSSTTIFFLFSFLNLNFNILSSLFVFSVFFQSLLIVIFLFFLHCISALQKWRRGKKKFTKTFFWFWTFFLSNISFCKLLYHQIGGALVSTFFFFLFSFFVCFVWRREIWRFSMQF